MSLNRTFADAVVAALNAPPAEGEDPFSMPFTATSAKVPDYDMKDLETLRVTVVSRAKNSTRASRRGHWQKVLPVEIVVQKKISFPGSSPRTKPQHMEALKELVAPLEDFVEELAEFMAEVVIEDTVPIEVEQLLYDEDALLDHEYFSMIRLTYMKV